MKNVAVIARRELLSCLSGPIAYIVAATILGLSGLFFVPGVLVHRAPNLVAWTANVAIILVVLVPALSMRLIAEERRSGTLELMLTSPVQEWELVLGKYAGALALYALIMALLLEYPIAFLVIREPDDAAPIWIGMIGLCLIGALFLAVGLLFSSLTRSQAAAYFASFGCLLLLYLAGWTASAGFWGDFLRYVSLQRQILDFAHGVLDSRDLVLYASGIGLSLLLATRSLLSFR